MWNIIIGLVFIVAGLSGQLALRGTSSGPALAGLGGILLIWGIVQVSRKRNECPSSATRGAVGNKGASPAFAIVGGATPARRGRV